MIQTQAKEIHNFFNTQAFADGVRATFAILLPALAGAFSGHFEAGITMALGAMCVSLTDAPGPIRHKVNGMLACIAFIFSVSLVTAFARVTIATMTLEIALVTFFFSMLTVFGARASAVGSASILIMILTMDAVVPAGGPVGQAALVAAGGVSYLLLTLLLYRLRPYRMAQRVLGDCIREMASFLAVKATFYDLDTDLEKDYRNLITRQVTVQEKQDAVREVFFKTRQIVQESSRESKRLVYAFVSGVDLFEEITASYYDYAHLRKRFGDSGVLALLAAFLRQTARELDNIGVAIQNQERFHPTFNYDEALRTLKAGSDALVHNSTDSVLIRKIIVNVRRLLRRMQELHQYFERDVKQGTRGVDHTRFVSHQQVDTKLFMNNLSMDSSVFRHALRVSISSVTGYFIAQLLGYDNYSYWILLTIAFILKPAFSLTRQRNIHRLIGTLAGGATGVLILMLFSDERVLFFFMVVFMLGTYSFLRVNYLAMVICTTPYVLILFTLFGAGFREVATERLLDTAIGCIIALAAGYFLFPRWESQQLGHFTRRILQAHATYLQLVIRALNGEIVSLLDYKLARKNLYLNLANLSAAFDRMLSEPKNKQAGAQEFHQFVVLNHILFSNLASVGSTLLQQEHRRYPQDLVQVAVTSYKTLGEHPLLKGSTEQAPVVQREGNRTPDDVLMKEQLLFIRKLVEDMMRVPVHSTP